jgi:ubiquinone/menaquinone biosynthesis C-methylase UbiE
MELYRQIALLTDMTSENEVLDVACGKGVSLEYFVREFEVVGSGVDIDASLVEQAEARSRDLGMAERLQFQIGRSDELPYRDEIFDVAVGEIGLASHCEPEKAVRELVRVTKPGGFVVLVQLVWKAPVEEERQDVLVEHLGARPRMVVEWKRFLREAAVEEVHTEDWSDQETSFRSAVAKPFPDFAELFSLPEKIGIVRRAWRQWGWRGVYTVLGRERAVHRLLTRERILGLDLLKGRKAGEMQGTGEEKRDAAIVGQGREGMRTAPEEEGLVQEDRLETSGDRGGGPRPDGEAQDHEGPRATETAGLPLFGEGAPDSPSRD